MPDLLTEHTDWTKNTLAQIKIGGTWFIPRSLTRVIKLSENTVRIVDFVPGTENLLREYIRAAGFSIFEEQDCN